MTLSWVQPPPGGGREEGLALPVVQSEWTPRAGGGLTSSPPQQCSVSPVAEAAWYLQVGGGQMAQVKSSGPRCILGAHDLCSPRDGAAVPRLQLLFLDLQEGGGIAESSRCGL